MTTPIEKRIRWSGLLVVLGLVVLLVSLSWPHPLSFMAFLAVGCPLILIGILVYLWALAVKDGRTATNVVLLLMLSPLVFTSCRNDDDLIRRVAEGQTPDGKSSELPVFDPTTATAKIFGKVILEGKPEIPKVRQPAKPASLDLRLPPGKYELVAWHEKFGEQVSSFEAAANSPREVNFTFSVAPKQ